MKFKLFLVWFSIVVATGVVYAFSNSLDRSYQNGIARPNNFRERVQNQSQNNFNQPYKTAQPSSMSNENAEYNNVEMNDTRYNSNCQFGQCIPGGMTGTSFP